MALRIVPDYGAGTIADALLGLGATDEVQIRAGSYAEGGLYVGCGTFGPFPGDEDLVTIDGSGVAADTLRIHAAATVRGLSVIGRSGYEAVQLNVDGVTVEDMSFLGTYGNGIQATAGNDNHTLRRNRFFGSTSGSGYAIDLNGTGNTVENNLVVGSHYRGIRPGAGACQHNTVVGCADHGYYVDLAATLRNNVAYANGGAGFYLHHAGADVDYALAYLNASPYTVGAGGTWGGHNLTTDPLFEDVGAGDYRPGIGSPLLGAALEVGVTDDVAGDLRPVGAPDIGAYERQSTPPRVTSAVWQSRTSVLVTFDQAMDPGHNLTTAGSWDVLALFGGDAVTVDQVTIVSAESVLLTVTAQGWDTLYGAICPVGVENVFGDPIGASDREADYVTPIYREPESPDAWAVTAEGAAVELDGGVPFELVPWAADAPLTSLEEAVWLSLFSDRRADDDEPVPDDAGDPACRGGWWADALTGDAFGSRLWLLAREPVTDDVVNRARDYAAEALQWLVDDGLAARVDVATERRGMNGLAMTVSITKKDGTTEAYRFDNLWAAEV